MKKRNRTLIYLFVIMGVLSALSYSCKKSEDTNLSSKITVTDIDGNVYNTVTIGQQVWMVENLKTTKYRNGDVITAVSENTSWNALSTGAQCNYNNDAADGTKYGKLYNWYAVKDNRNITPSGWHVPTDAEWTTLKNYMDTNLGTSGSVAKALAAKTDWATSTNAGAIGYEITRNNFSGFTALPGGGRDIGGSYIRVDYSGFAGYWWSSTEVNSYSAWNRSLGYNSSSIGSYDGNGKRCGFSVRCVKD